MATSEDEGGPPHFSVGIITTDENSTSSSSDDDNEHDDISSSGKESPATSATTYEPPFKKTKHNNGHESVTPAIKKKREWSKSYSAYSSKAINMMHIMGYKEDKGLGKTGQGILTPIEASRQEGRRGFGLKLEGLDASAVKWNPSMENVELQETMYWLKNDDLDFLDNLTMEDLSDWIVRGPEKLTIEDETKFCDPLILQNVLSSKSVFDDLDPGDMRRARTRSNPFETIRGNIFLNRAAVKMANLDSLCNFMFTNPVDSNDKSLIKTDDLLYFADICAGPGGFSEYILYRKGWEAKGFGFTLRNENDFKLSDFLAGPPETFDPYYGVKENGDIYEPENQESFAEYVLRQTNTGVHFVMADGGFSVEGKENIQEILSKQLYLCQCLVALSILREKGHFVCKIFDLFTPFSVGLIYLMYKCFEEISICKPNTSRPANSERYLICKWKKPNTETIRRHLSIINQEMFEHSKENVLELVTYDVLKEDEAFFSYIYESNNRIGHNQIVGLIKIAAYCNDKTLKEIQQAENKQKCLILWKLEDKMRKNPESPPTNEALLEALLKEWKDDKTFLINKPYDLRTTKDLEKVIHKAVYDWYFVPVCREETEKNIKTFFLSKGKGNVLKLNSGKWEPIDCCLEMSPKTLIYGELVTELIGEGRSQSQVNSLHIIDGIVLGGKDIHRLPLKERIRMCTKFARALNKPSKGKNLDGTQQQIAPIRCKTLFSLSEIQSFFDRMRMYKLKDGSSRLGFRIRHDDIQERFFVPGGLMFFNEANPPYVCALSKSSKKLYYHNSHTNEAYFIDNLPENVRNTCFASFRCSFYRRLFWKWTNLYQVEQNVDASNREENLLYRDDLYNYILKISSR